MVTASWVDAHPPVPRRDASTGSAPHRPTIQTPAYTTDRLDLAISNNRGDVQLNRILDLVTLEDAFSNLGILRTPPSHANFDGNAANRQPQRVLRNAPQLVDQVPADAAHDTEDVSMITRSSTRADALRLGSSRRLVSRRLHAARPGSIRHPGGETGGGHQNRRQPIAHHLCTPHPKP